MKLHEHLDSDTKRKLGVTSKDKGNIISKRRKRNKKCNERLSERDLADLMGTNRPTYGRHRGAYRQR